MKKYILFFVTLIILCTVVLNQAVEFVDLSPLQTAAPLQPSEPLQAALPLQVAAPPSIPDSDRWLTASLEWSDNLEAYNDFFKLLPQTNSDLQDLEFSYTPQFLEAAINKIINSPLPSLARLPPVVYNPTIQSQASPR